MLDSCICAGLFKGCCVCSAEILIEMLVNCKISALVPFYFCLIVGMCPPPVRTIIVSGMLVYCFAGMCNYCIRYVRFLHLCWSV